MQKSGFQIVIYTPQFDSSKLNDIQRSQRIILGEIKSESILREQVEKFIKEKESDKLFIVANFKHENMHDKSRMYLIKNMLLEMRNILEKKDDL